MSESTSLRMVCAGLQKSGTSSLRYALKSIGWRCLGYLRGQVVTPETLVARAGHFDAMLDLPAAACWRQLADATGCRVILTPRDDHDWADSIEDWMRPDHHPMSTPAEFEFARSLFGSVSFDRERWIAAKRRHEDAVRAWGERNPRRFLELDVIGGDGWEKLAPFIGVDRSGQFPRIRPGAPVATWETCGVRPAAEQGATWRT